MDNAEIYLRLVGARVRGQMQYRVSFLMQVLATFSTTLMELLSILIFFRTFHDLAGWSVGEVTFLYGLVSVAFGITEMVGAGFDTVALLVRSGEFDRVLTRPVPAFVQVLGTDFQLRRIGRIAQGILALALGQAALGIPWTAPKMLVLVAAVLSSSLVFLGVMMMGAAVCFWTVETTELQNVFTYGGTMLTSYPIHVYNRWLQMAFLYLVPLALTSYYPALYILNKPDPLGLPGVMRFLAPLVAAAFFALGLWVWRLGLRHYQSTGS